jgi:hypothetical protein
MMVIITIAVSFFGLAKDLPTSVGEAFFKLNAGARWRKNNRSWNPPKK